jgi:hypothetical protein
VPTRRRQLFVFIPISDAQPINCEDNRLGIFFAGITFGHATNFAHFLGKEGCALLRFSYLAWQLDGLSVATWRTNSVPLPLQVIFSTTLLWR